MWLLIGLFVVLVCKCVTAQFPPPLEGLKVVQSKVGNGARISYKEPNICETTPGVKSYSGYIHLPQGSLLDTGINNRYEINLFFWYFRARKSAERAPLALWLTGGPGASSLKATFQENGPCFVNQDSRTTRLNSWSWNREANMLYIDQPVQSGFSYDSLRNGSVDLFTDRLGPRILRPNFQRPLPQTAGTFLRPGTFPTNKRQNTANTTANAARTLWMAMQVFLSDFAPHETSDQRISLWGESYGGRYAPVSAATWLRLNDRVSNTSPSQYDPVQARGYYKPIKLDSVGIVSGCVDRLVEGTYLALYATNNTYGLKLASESSVQSVVNNWGQCAAAIQRCRSVVARSDPNNYGRSAEANQACNVGAQQACMSLDLVSDRSRYDIAAPGEEAFPPYYMIGYLQQASVQQALGARINYTEVMESVNQVFEQTGDRSRAGPLEDLGFLLDRNIKVAMVYGDRDAACNWMSGEAVSKGISWKGAETFNAAGYTQLKIDTGEVRGMTRQHGPLSFTRVFQAGHSVPAFAPRASYNIFRRLLNNLDVGTGLMPLPAFRLSSYSTEGPQEILSIKEPIGKGPPSECYLLAMTYTCTAEQERGIRSGKATIKDYIVT